MSYRSMIVIGTLLMALGMWLNPAMPGLWLLLVPAFVRGIAQGMLNPSLYTLVLDGAPVNARAAVMAFNGMLQRTGQTFGPLIFGFVYLVGGMDSVFHIASVALVASAAWIFLGVPTRAEARP